MIDVVIEKLEQQFSKSIAASYFVTTCEFVRNTIDGVGRNLSGLYSAAFLYSDDQPRRSLVRLKSGVTETVHVFHFRIYIMHAA